MPVVLWKTHQPVHDAWLFLSWHISTNLLGTEKFFMWFSSPKHKKVCVITLFAISQCNKNFSLFCFYIKHAAEKGTQFKTSSKWGEKHWYEHVEVHINFIKSPWHSQSYHHTYYSSTCSWLIVKLYHTKHSTNTEEILKSLSHIGYRVQTDNEQREQNTKSERCCKQRYQIYHLHFGKGRKSWRQILATWKNKSAWHPGRKRVKCVRMLR